MTNSVEAKEFGPQVEVCAHHWMLESPAGEFAKGVCKNCGDVKEDYFRNASQHQNLYNGKPKMGRRNVLEEPLPDNGAILSFTSDSSRAAIPTTEKESDDFNA